MKPVSSVPPLARNVGREVLDWDYVEPTGIAHPPAARDALGLSEEDRVALGLSAHGTTSHVPPAMGDATAALAEALAHGGAYGKRARK